MAATLRRNDGGIPVMQQVAALERQRNKKQCALHEAQ